MPGFMSYQIFIYIKYILSVKFLGNENVDTVFMYVCIHLFVLMCIVINISLVIYFYFHWNSILPFFLVP